MNNSLTMRTAALAVSLLSAAFSAADLTTFLDRAEFESAAGSELLREGFDGFDEELSLNTYTAQLNGFTLRANDPWGSSGNGVGLHDYAYLVTEGDRQVTLDLTGVGRSRLPNRKRAFRKGRPFCS